MPAGKTITVLAEKNNYFKQIEPQKNKVEYIKWFQKLIVQNLQNV